MKKKTVFIFICLILFFGSCNLQIPEKVILKTKPTYNFSIGSFSKSFSEELSMKPLFNSLEEKDSRIKVYDYNPNNQSEYQQFLVKMPIQEIPLNFGDFVDSIGLSSSVGDMSFSREIKIPEIKVEKTAEFDISGLKNIIKGFVAGKRAADDNNNYVVELFDGKNNFTSISYTSGSLLVTGSFDDGKAAQLIREDEIVLEKKFSSGVATFDLTDQTLYSDMKLRLPGEGEVNVYTNESSVIAAVEGLDYELQLPNPLEVELDIDTLNITRCKISKGKLVKEIESIPSTLSGISVKMEFSGAINGSIGGDKNELSLDNKELEEDSISASIGVIFSKAKINFTDSMKLGVNILFEVNCFAEIEMEVAQENLSFNKQFAFPQEVIDFIKTIYIKESGIEGTYTNTLPEGNDITIKAKSDFINLNGTETLFSNTKGEDFSLLSSTEEIGKTIDSTTKLDFDVDVILPGATELNPNLLNLKDVEAGKVYRLAIELGCKLDWTKVELNKIDTKNTEGAISTDFSLSSIFAEIDNAMNTDFASKMKIDSLPLYLYVEKPSISAFGNFAFSDTSSIKIGNGNVNGNSVEFISSPEEMTCSKMASFPKLDLAPNGDTVITDISEKEYTSNVNLNKIINEQSDGSSKLCIQYNIGLGMNGGDSSIVITKEDLENAKGGTSIAINLAIIVPLKFDLSERMEIDVLELAGITFEDENKDLFNRTGKIESDELNMVLDNIRNATLFYDIKKSPFNTQNSIELKVELTPSDIFNLSFDKGQITITPEQVKRILETFPLQPKVLLEIPASDFFLLRDKEFEIDSFIQIATDVEVELFGGQK